MQHTFLNFVTLKTKQNKTNKQKTTQVTIKKMITQAASLKEADSAKLPQDLKQIKL